MATSPQPGSGAPFFPGHLGRRSIQEGHGGIEYAGLPVKCSVLPGGPMVLVYRARPRNAIIARSTSTTCSAVSRPTRVWTFDLLTVVSLSIITSLS